jgi:(p)ppGpp synthase/HD superfamily hydrolase
VTTLSAPHLGDRFDRALVYASQLHRAQVRKGTRIPYVSHLLAVASLVMQHGGIEDEAIGGLLHDALEDHPSDGQTEKEIGEQFGPTVLEIVRGCSDSTGHPKPPWRERKARYLRHLVETATPSVLLVSASDNLHNARSILCDYRSHGDELWRRFTTEKAEMFWYYEALRGAFGYRKVARRWRENSARR